MRNLFVSVLKILPQHTKVIPIIFGSDIIKHSASGSDKKITKKKKVCFSWLIYSSTSNKHKSKNFQANFKVTLVSMLGQMLLTKTVSVSPLPRGKGGKGVEKVP